LYNLVIKKKKFIKVISFFKIVLCTLFVILPYNLEDLNNVHHYLKIPKINMELEFFEFGHKLNNVDQNIEILKGSTLPDKTGTLVIAGHSGIGSKAYFNI